jgi:hypothetical protein
MGNKKVDSLSSTTASATVPKATTPTTRSSATADVTAAKGLQCDWARSTMTKREENKMCRLGLISNYEKDIRFPSAESRPKPPAGFIVMFVAFFYRGYLFQPTSFFVAFSFPMESSSGS